MVRRESSDHRGYATSTTCPIPNDTLVQLFCLSLSDLVGSGYNERTEIGL
jgi:hypothetical protein